MGMRDHRDGATDPAERARLRAEIDGLVAHLYGLTDEEFLHILATFPLVPEPEKIICVGVNFPDRNEEYRDGRTAPPNPSLFVRFPRSFTAHGAPLIRPPESPQLDYEGEIVMVIGKGGKNIRKVTRQLEERFNLDYHFKHVDTIFARVFG